MPSQYTFGLREFTFIGPGLLIEEQLCLPLVIEYQGPVYKFPDCL